MTATSPHAGAPATAGPPAARSAPAAARRALVVGASSGIGAALVRQLAAEGCRVAAVARRRGLLDELARSCAESCAASGGEVLVREHDVTDAQAVPALFEEIVRALGGLDLIVYAAGVMPAVGPNEYDTEKDLGMIAVNLGGCVAWCNEAARLFGTQRHGTIVGISSVAGVRGRKGNPVYGTTKAAMDHYLEALRNRLADVGAHVCTVCPGYVDTPMTEGLDLRGAISADAAARAILGAARWRRNTRYVPRRWWAVAQVVRGIPSFLFKRMNV